MLSPSAPLGPFPTQPGSVKMEPYASEEAIHPPPFPLTLKGVSGTLAASDVSSRVSFHHLHRPRWNESLQRASPEPPYTQLQCNQGMEPELGFSLDASHRLLYRGSSEFWACPATEAEYNIYVKPDFGQTKCVPVALTASGCESPAVSACDLLPTEWQTRTLTVTEDVAQTVTVVVTETPSDCVAPAYGIAGRE